MKKKKRTTKGQKQRKAPSASKKAKGEAYYFGHMKVVSLSNLRVLAYGGIVKDQT